MPKVTKRSSVVSGDCLMVAGPNCPDWMRACAFYPVNFYPGDNRQNMYAIFTTAEGMLHHPDHLRGFLIDNAVVAIPRFVKSMVQTGGLRIHSLNEHEVSYLIPATTELLQQMSKFIQDVCRGAPPERKESVSVTVEQLVKNFETTVLLVVVLREAADSRLRLIPDGAQKLQELKDAGLVETMFGSIRATDLGMEKLRELEQRLSRFI